MSIFMKKWYSKLPNDLQKKINNMVIQQYNDELLESKKKIKFYLLNVIYSEIDLKYFHSNESFNREYPHKLDTTFRHRYNRNIGGL